MSAQPSFDPIKLYDQALNSTEPLRIFLQQRIPIVRSLEDTCTGHYVVLKKFELLQPKEQEAPRIRIVYAISRQGFLPWSIEHFQSVTYLNTPRVLEMYSMRLSDGRPNIPGEQIINIQSKEDPLTIDVFLTTRLSPDEQEYDPKFRAYNLRQAEINLKLQELKGAPF